MIRPLQTPGERLSSPDTLRVSPGLAEYNSVNWATLCGSNPPPEHQSSAPRRPLISLPMTKSQLPAEPRKTDVAGFVDLASLPGMSYYNYDADDESDDSLDLGGAEGKPPLSLKQSEFTLKQFANRMWQANDTSAKCILVTGSLQECLRGCGVQT